VGSFARSILVRFVRFACREMELSSCDARFFTPCGKISLPKSNPRVESMNMGLLEASLGSIVE